MASWVDGADGSGFGADHLPYGVVCPPGGGPRPVVRIGEHALDLRALARARALPEADEAFEAADLTAFLRLGAPAWSATRARLLALAGAAEVPPAARGALLALDGAEVRLPFAVGDFVDFYASEEHATTVGRLFRPEGAPLLPNWRHLPVGYHGRAGTVAVTGTPVRRPSGQRTPEAEGEPPAFGPEPRLDFELELGFVCGDGPPAGTPLTTAAAPACVLGVVLVNDWSARAIQRWEYQPLGPFLGKSFLTSISAWVTPLEALAERRTAGPAQDPAPLPYLRAEEPWAIDADLEVAVSPAGSSQETVVCRVNAARLYWTLPQLLAHATVNGAAIRAGDLFATGTISGWDPGSKGCLLEATAAAREPLTLAGGERRAFLEDGDTVVLRGRAGSIALGEVRGTVAG